MKNLVFAAAAAALLAAPAQRPAENFDPKQIVAMEKAALDRWGRGDPQGYFEIMAPEITYFDPSTEKRIDGLPALRKMIEPYTGKIKIERYEMVNPQVQRHGDIALLTFNLLNFRKLPDGKEQVTLRWNSTETYARVGGHWRIIHSHWSFTKPELKNPPAGPQ
jgi:ketosteroid isomerase-like protein